MIVYYQSYDCYLSVNIPVYLKVFIKNLGENGCLGSFRCRHIISNQKLSTDLQSPSAMQSQKLRSWTKG